MRVCVCVCVCVCVSMYECMRGREKVGAKQASLCLHVEGSVERDGRDRHCDVTERVDHRETQDSPA